MPQAWSAYRHFAALDWAAKIPNAKDGSVEVRPVMVFDEDGSETPQATEAAS